MNRFDQLFANPENKAFIPFFTIGDPDLEHSYELVSAAAEAGADAVELGIPFSDPIADGPANQRSMERARQAGATFERCLEFLARLRKAFPGLPIGLLLYYNLLVQQGEPGYQRLAEAGVDAIVSADLPLEEAQEHRHWLHHYGIGAVQMIAMNTPDKRALALMQGCSAFAYVLSGFGVTGAKAEVAPQTLERVAHVRRLSDCPIVVGFGISHPDHVRRIWDAGANGAIVGSHFTNLIEQNLEKPGQARIQISEFIQQVNHSK